ncbi:hypothetical protein SK128_009316 [Halocaridina rubra]|uniref:Uncharacterized protein n=1 Tax=Halocaridina rubra TaxID=373956 RepID=A0AAN8WKV1_HALRR
MAVSTEEKFLFYIKVSLQIFGLLPYRFSEYGNIQESRHLPGLKTYPRHTRDYPESQGPTSSPGPSQDFLKVHQSPTVACTQSKSNCFLAEKASPGCKELCQDPIFSPSLFTLSLAIIGSYIPGSYIFYLLVMCMDGSSAGGLALRLSLFLAFLSFSVGETFVFCKSKTLVSLVQKIGCIVSRDRECKIKRHLFLEAFFVVVLCLGLSCMKLLLGFKYLDAFSLLEIVVEFICSMLMTMRFGILVIFFRFSCLVITRHTLNLTRDAVSKSYVLLDQRKLSIWDIRYLLSTDENSETPDPNSAIYKDEALAPLYELERKIHQMKILREQMASIYFEFMSLLVLFCTSLMVTSGFSMLTGEWQEVRKPVVFVFCAGMLIYTCSIGDQYSSGIMEAMDALNSLSCSCKDPATKNQVRIQCRLPRKILSCFLTKK